MQALLYTCLALLGTIWNFNENSVLCKILYVDNFCFEKIYPRWKLFTVSRPSHPSLPSGKNNHGFSTNDLQEKHNFVYLVGCPRRLRRLSGLGQKLVKPSAFVRRLVMAEHLFKWTAFSLVQISLRKFYAWSFKLRGKSVRLLSWFYRFFCPKKKRGKTSNLLKNGLSPSHNLPKRLSPQYAKMSLRDK